MSIKLDEEGFQVCAKCGIGECDRFIAGELPEDEKCCLCNPDNETCGYCIGEM